MMTRKPVTMPSAREIAEAKAIVRKKEKGRLDVDWVDPKSVRAFVDKYLPVERHDAQVEEESSIER